jgi:hypothetical protein
MLNARNDANKADQRRNKEENGSEAGDEKVLKESAINSTRT